VRQRRKQAPNQPSQVQEEQQRKLAVALSGGGHRACLFALGVLLYLVDAGRNGDVTSIASVSGGSLANGAVAQSLDFTSARPRQLEAVVARLAGQITGQGTLFGAPLAKAYIALLTLTAIAALIGPWLLPLSFGLQIVVFILAILALAWLAGLRGRVCARAFATTLFTPEGCPDRLDSICDDLDHVFCATNLHTGGHTYFTQRLVTSSGFGAGVPGDIELSTVVQASAAFPGAFPVSWQPTARHKFSKRSEPEAASVRKMALVDGGVYANMADQWVRRYDRLPPWRADDPTVRNATELIAVSSSAGLEWSSQRRLHLPVIGELLTLLRDKDILYNNGNSLRRHGLVSLFKLAERDGEGLRGSLVHISQSPCGVPLAWCEDDGEKGSRANAALDTLGVTDGDGELVEAHWEGIAKENSNVPTTLFRLKPAIASRLLHHAYVLAMANLHVHLDYPLLPVPDISRFDQLVRGNGSL
jgi:predicted acylesterase/phospholipase RssA